MSSYPQPSSGYGPQSQPGTPPPTYGQSVPPYGQYQPPMPGQPGYQWGAAVPTYPFANFGQRLGALLIDVLILLVAMTIPMILGIVCIVNSVETYDNLDGTTHANVTNGGLLALGIVVIGIAFIIGLLYEPLQTARKNERNGQTIGRRALGIRITSLQGGPITTGQAWGRFLFRQFLSGSVFYLGYLWVLWDPMKQGWHDKVANTLVLRAR